eukprot:TRINITY_DN395_c3_g1_i3.p1 TRINITY_DN395_c3_g1~~TRINITY_DN395_c3_g1_i3.p1  ORF type:complete len:194 (+),score=21.96 TRINITY_DN395_c3_g1_i3:59-640(+)
MESRLLTAAIIEPFKSLLSKTKILYATSFGLTTLERVSAVKSAYSFIDTSHSILVINLSSAALQNRPIVMGALCELLPRAAMVLGNLKEFESFCSAHGLSSLEDFRNKFSTTHVVVTNSSKPTVFMEVGKPVREVEVPFVSPESIVDTNGAGDAFAGGVLASMLHNPLNYDRAIENGHHCASVIIKRRGCELL